jgi:hypothetical protein
MAQSTQSPEAQMLIFRTKDKKRLLSLSQPRGSRRPRDQDEVISHADNIHNHIH